MILYNCSFSILLQWRQSVVHTQVTNWSPLFSSDVHETGCVLSKYSNCKLFKWCFLIIFQDESGTMLTNVSACGDILPPTSSRQPTSWRPISPQYPLEHQLCPPQGWAQAVTWLVCPPVIHDPGCSHYWCRAQPLSAAPALGRQAQGWLVQSARDMCSFMHDQY